MLKVKLNNTSKFTLLELIKLKKAVEVLEQVINSSEFRSKVLSIKFENNEGMTSLEIYNLLMTGKEVLSPAADSEINIDIEMYYSLKGVIGYTYPNTLRTWINRRFFKRMTPAEIANNLIHEWLHKVGFDHDFYPTKRRVNSVPYAIGYLVQNLAGK